MPDRRITFLASDFGNGGVVAFYRSFQKAASSAGWHVAAADGKGDVGVLGRAFSDALVTRPDGIVFGGFEPGDYPDLVERAVKEGIVLVGWHAAARPGPTKDLFVNIATETAAVAEMAARYVLTKNQVPAGIVIFNDNRFDVANAKTEAMRELILKSKTGRVLEVVNIEIPLASKEVPKAVARLNSTYGRAWTHSLAINDVYFDNMNLPLRTLGRDDIVNVSAGDGSDLAISRIRTGQSQQAATVAEPLDIQGWQTVDELNRAFWGGDPSGYISQPKLLTTEALRDTSAHEAFDQAARNTYLRIWGKL